MCVCKRVTLITQSKYLSLACSLVNIPLSTKNSATPSDPKFKTEGTNLDKDRKGQPRTARTPQNIQGA